MQGSGSLSYERLVSRGLHAAGPRSEFTTRAALLATAPFAPMVTPLSPLVPPKSSKKFHIPSHWGNLSPYHSVKSHGLDNASPLIPAGCRLDELHWLQRHGARYPTSAPGGAEDFAARLKEAKSVGEGWEVKGELAWLQDWEYKLGREVLTPFGRSQLYNLGVAARVKYGFLLEGFKGRLPVFRTETQEYVHLARCVQIF